MLTTVLTLNVVSLVLLLGAIGVGTTLAMTKVNPPRREPVKDEEHMPGPQLRIDDAIYNLGEPDHYMKAALMIELDVTGMKEKEVAEFQNEARLRLPWMRDLLISELSGKTYRQLSTAAGKEEFKEELRIKFNGFLTRGQIREVMFTSFAAQ